MKKIRLKSAILLFLLGMTGVLSTLTNPIPLEKLPEDVRKISYEGLKLLMLINPTILLIAAIVSGILLHEKVNLKLQMFYNGLRKEKINLAELIKPGLLGGLVAGTALLAIAGAFSSFIQKELLELGKQLNPNIVVRLLYGGFTEEILTRFGIMTVLVWLLFKIFKTLSVPVYWVGISVSSLLFAVAHLPQVLFFLPDPSPALIAYIITANTAGGIIFGFLYWKKGLEAAFMAHMTAHLVILMVERFLHN